MKKILLSMLAVLSILFLITACGDKPGDNPVDPSAPEKPSEGVQSKTLKQRINEAQDGDIIDLGKEEIEIKHGDSYTIDKSITIKNGDAKYATFIVESTGATLLNLRNIESVIADEQLDDGDLAIRNCYEVASVYVNGGGSNSIHIASTSIKNLYVAKENVRIVLKADDGTNATKVENIQINSNCKLESEDADASFGKVQISADVETVTLAGKAKVEKILAETAITEDAEEAKATVAIESSDVKIEKTSANVELTVSEKVEEEIQLPETEVINTTYTVTTVVAGKNSSYKVYEGYQFSSEPIEYGYKFIGWYFDENFTKAVTIPYAVEKDVTLYAKFEKIQYESSFFVVGEGFVSSEVGKKYYTDLELGTIKGATIKTESGYDVITIPSATSTSDVWSYWADSLENWNFKANKNYKISVEIKADAKTLVVLQAKAKNSNNANQKKVEVGTEWQTVEIETGCWNKDFLGYLQVACGCSNKTYLRNLKMEEVSTKSIPAGTWGSDADSISVTQVENGVKFTFEKESAAWTNGAAIRGNFVETSKNYLYKVKFTAVADANNVEFNYSIDSWAEDNAWGKATIGTTATDFELYMPAYQVDGDEIRGAEINISIATKNSVTITDVSFEPLTTIPSDQVIFFTSDYVNYQRITSTGKDNCIVLEVAGQKEAEIRFVMEKAENSAIKWDNSCSFGKFENKSSATVAIPEDKDYPVLKNTSKTSQSYRLYIDETWKIVIEDFVPVKYTVNFVTTEETSGVVVESQNVESGTEIELQQLADIEGTETFKEFAGWYEGVVKKSDGTLDWTNAKAVTSPYTVTKDVTLYAKFEKKQYESKFFIVGGEVVSSEIGKNYYPGLTVGTVKGATIKTESGYDVITVNNATSTSDVWSIWAASKESWNFEANKNYKISVDIKAEEKTLIVLQSHVKNAYNANSKNIEVGTEWQTVEIETGCWNKDFLGHLQVACGQSKKTYLRNLKMEEVSTKLIPTGTWGADTDSISVTQVENGVKFTFEKAASIWTNGAAIRGNFVETSKNYLYKVSFTAVSDAEDVSFEYSIDSWAEDNAWGKATIGTTPSNFELYMPAYQLDGDEIRGAEINISIATNNSVTITNVKFESLVAIPSNQIIFFTSDYNNYQRITATGKDNFIELKVPANSEAELRFVMEKASNSSIQWNNSTSFSKFDNKASATVTIPEGKDYPVLKNTSNTSQTYKLYIDETWKIVIEDKIEEATINFVTCYDHNGIVAAPITAPIGNQVTLSEIENQSGANFYAIFEGWYENVLITKEGTLDFSSAILVTSPYTVTKDVTLYAKWNFNENQFKGTWHGSYDGNSHWYLIFSDDTMTFYAGELDGISPYTYSGNSATLTEDSWTDDLEIKTDGTINYEDTNFSRVEENVENDPFTGVWITYSEKYYTGFMVLQASNGTAFQVIDGEIETSDLTYTVSENIVTINDSVQFEISGNSFNLNGDTFYRAYDVDFSKIDEFWPTTTIDETNFTANDSAIVITKSDTEVMIENPNAATGSEWDYYVTAAQEFDMNANQNYKVSVEVKSDTTQSVRFVLKDSYASADREIVNTVKTATTEWQTVEFETGVLQGDWRAYLEIPVGRIDTLYVRNFKVEAIDTKVISVRGKADSLITDKTEDGFTVQIDDTSEYIGISGIKAEYGNIYCVSFDVSATVATTLSFFYKASTGNYADGGTIQEIDSTTRKITAYVPHVGSNFGIEYNFMSLGFSVDNPTTLALSNFEVTTVDKSDLSMIPNVYLTTDGENYAELTPCDSGENFTTVEVAGYGQSGNIFALTQDPWSGSLKWEGTYIDLRTAIKGDESANFELWDVEGRDSIYNKNSVATAYKIWINKNYEIVVEEVTYQVTFNLDGGNIDGSTDDITKKTVSLSVVTPKKDGYTFIGWTETQDSDDYITSATSDITVYAKWIDNLEIFANGDIVGDFSVVQDENGDLVYSEYAGIPFTSEGDGVYSATFIYDSSYMKGWGSPSGTCAFKARTVANSWDGTSYGIADPANQPIIGGEAVLIDAVQGDNIVVTGLVSGTTYKITVTCSQDGTVTVKVDAL